MSGELGYCDPHRWDSQGDWPLMPNIVLITALQAFSLGFPQSLKEKDLTLFRALISNVLLAHQVGKWVSYSRNADFYNEPRQYRTPEYTYGRTMRLIDLLLELGLIEEQRRLPHAYGFQSRIRSTQKLTEAIGHPSTPRWEPVQLVELRREK